MHPFDEMKAWVGFGPDDEARLRALWPEVRPRLDALTDTFYARILQFPSAAAVFRDESQVARLKVSLRRWLEELLSGPWDEAYFGQRERIGRVHILVRLPSHYMFTAMAVMVEGLCAIARGAPDLAGTTLSIIRITNLDLAIMTGTYVESREAAQRATLQDLIVSNMPVTVLLLDADGVVTAATRPGTRLFGDVPVIGRDWTEALPPALVQSARLEEHVARVTTTGREIVLTRVDAALDGLERAFRLALVPLEHPHARLLLHVEELTDTVQAEQRLARAESLAQLGALSTAVAHELRNPLAGITGTLQVISRSLAEDDPRRRVMEEAEQLIFRLNHLITDLLDFARPIEARGGELRLETLALQAGDQVRRDHPELRVQVQGAGGAWGDPALVLQILHNLLQNAAVAVSGRGEIRVHVSPGEVRVSDSGPGIPLENLDKIFSPFFTTHARGTGLGLAICRKAAAAMGAHLGLSTGPLSGATFQLVLPRLRPA